MNKLTSGLVLVLCLMLIGLNVIGQKAKTIDYTFPLNKKTYSINVIEYEDYYLFHGDIRLPKNSKKGLLAQGAGIWNCGEIPITYDSSITQAQRDQIEEIILYINAATKLTVKNRTNESSYVKIQSIDPTCYSSSLGMNGGEQIVNLGLGCFQIGVIIHEIFHAAGLMHEQARSDRDNYVTINYSNIPGDAQTRFQFDILPGTLLGPYDFESLMHYGAFDFAIDDNFKTITTNNGEEIGQRQFISAGDISSINSIYPCGTASLLNDICQSATDIEIGQLLVINNTGASSSNTPFSCYSSGNNDIWYKVNTNTDIYIETMDAGTGLSDLVVQAFTGSCTNLSEIACNDDGGIGNHSLIETSGINTNQTIFIRVTDFGGDDEGIFRFYVSELACESERVNQSFGSSQGWGSDNPRLIGDFNGDGMDDMVGFGNSSTIVATSDGTTLSNAMSLDYFSRIDGWRIDRHPRLVGDFNGDGIDDIIGFANAGTRVALSDGSNLTVSSGFSKPIFSFNNSWVVDKYPRLVGDFNGDGIDDIVGFGSSQTFVGISTGNTIDYDPSFTLSYFAYSDGWRIERHPRLVGDFNGDGFDDIVGFANTGTRVALSDGSSLSVASGFSHPFWGYNNGFRVDRHPRLVGDFNGDGIDDLIGFANAGVRVLISDGTKFIQDSNFSTNNFGYVNGGWNPTFHVRLVGDFNGDGLDDFMGLGNATGAIVLSNGTSFDPPMTFTSCYTYDQDWSVLNDVRSIGDFNGDGADDVIAMGNRGTYIHFNNQTCLPEISSANGNKLVGAHITSRDYEVSGEIESEKIIHSGNSIKYDSGTSILLDNGFEVEKKSTFHALIDGCGNL